MSITIILQNRSFEYWSGQSWGQFQEYLLWKLFIVKTDINPLTYIITTLNLDVTCHCWVESLTGITFSIKYPKGQDNAATEALSWVTLRLETETVKSILDWVTVGWTGRADAHIPLVAETNEEIHKQVQEAAIKARAAIYVWICMLVIGWPLKGRI